MVVRTRGAKSTIGNMLGCCWWFIFFINFFHIELVSSTQDSYQPSQSSFDAPSSHAPNYKFEYGVHESKTGNEFGHEEERNGYVTTGQYRVRLPDGRLQVVTYTADQNGYKADVVYHPSGSSSSSYENKGGGGSSANSLGRNSRSSFNVKSQGQRRSSSYATITRMINGRTYHNDIGYY